jgi:hypothetical protein
MKCRTLFKGKFFQGYLVDETLELTNRVDRTYTYMRSDAKLMAQELRKILLRDAEMRKLDREAKRK